MPSPGQTSLDDFARKNVIAHFYPKAATPGCITGACRCRGNLNSLLDAGCSVLGIPPGAPAEIVQIAADASLNFPLLSAPDHTAAQGDGSYGGVTKNGNTFTPPPSWM